MAERQLVKEQQEDGTLQEAGASYQTPGPDPHLPASDERWALDALRNCKFCTCEGPGLCHGLRSHVGRIQRSGNSDFSLKEFYHLVGKKIENLPLFNQYRCVRIDLVLVTREGSIRRQGRGDYYLVEWVRLRYVEKVQVRIMVGPEAQRQEAPRVL